MDWRLIFLIVCSNLLLPTATKSAILDADYNDVDLMAEESKAFALSYANAGSSASSSSSSFGGYDYHDPDFNSHQHFGHYYPMPFNHYPPHPGHGHQAAFPSFPNKPHFHVNPTFQHQQPIPNNKNMFKPKPQRPINPPNCGFKPTQKSNQKQPTRIPIKPTRVLPVNPNAMETVPAMVAITPSDIPASPTTSTTEEPSYDIDIRFGDN